MKWTKMLNLRHAMFGELSRREPEVLFATEARACHEEKSAPTFLVPRARSKNTEESDP